MVGFLFIFDASGYGEQLCPRKVEAFGVVTLSETPRWAPKPLQRLWIECINVKKPEEATERIFKQVSYYQFDIRYVCQDSGYFPS